MRLTDIKNPLIQDSSKPLFIETPLGRAKVVGYTPELSQIFSGGGFHDKRPAYWHVLLDDDKPGYEKLVLDGEIIN